MANRFCAKCGKTCKSLDKRAEKIYNNIKFILPAKHSKGCDAKL